MQKTRTNPRKPRSVKELLSGGVSRLRAVKLDQPRLLCEHLVSHIIGCGRLELYMKFAETPAAAQARRIEAGIERLAAGEPLQYILGSADFMGRDFKVNRGCLIPRPETEELVDWTAGFDLLWRKSRPLIADVGTGCGCIAVTLALDRPRGRYIAVDISRRALDLARLNARRYGLENVSFRIADVLSGIEPDSLDAVISNPPYIRTSEWRLLERHVREHEPRIALDGGGSGLDVIGPLIEQSFRALKKGGLLFLETGDDQMPAVRALLRRAGFSECMVKKDFSGRYRMAGAVK